MKRAFVGPWLGVVVAAVLLAVGGAARGAATPDGARVHVDAAIAYFDEGDYAGAVRELEVAYRQNPVADIQYNLAQCYERLDRPDEAAAAWQRYLDGKPRADDAAEVQQRIGQLRERARAGRAGQSAPPKIVERTVFKTVVIFREPPPPPGRGARWAALSAGVLAVAGLATGITTAVLAARAVRDVERGGSLTAPPLFDGALRDEQQTARSEWIACGVGFGLAGLAAAGSTALLLLARRIDREAPKVTLAPLVAPGGGGLWAALRF